MDDNNQKITNSSGVDDQGSVPNQSQDAKDSSASPYLNEIPAKSIGSDTSFEEAGEAVNIVDTPKENVTGSSKEAAKIKEDTVDKIGTSLEKQEDLEEDSESYIGDEELEY